ncbi:MAG TPA: hypothetical protein VL119_06775 [Acidimicrobiia bacterium]|nr:hypothetical protein [Acidimicrobiia bacterium]
MSSRRATIPKRRRRREVWATLAVFVMAALAGLAAAHFGTRRAWENPSATTTSTSVPFVDPQTAP